MEKSLSICIPTYNRRVQLINTVKKLVAQKYEGQIFISIVNNVSDYDVEATLREELGGEFERYSIEIINNKYNVGGAINIMNCFSAAKTKWMWLLSDDDEPDKQSISDVLNYITKYSDCACLKFSQEQNLKQDVVLEGLRAFLDFMDQRLFSKGSLMFMSNSIFNLEKLNAYISHGFQNLTLTPHLVPLTLFMDKENGRIALINKMIVEQKPPRDALKEKTYLSTLIWEKYNFTTAILPLNIKSDKRYFNLYIKYFSSDSFLGNFLQMLRSKEREDSYSQYKVLYENSYRLLRTREKALARLFLLILSNRVFLVMADMGLRLLKPEFFREK